jgi:hypothetical protein
MLIPIKKKNFHNIKMMMMMMLKEKSQKIKMMMRLKEQSPEIEMMIMTLKEHQTRLK